jgi:PPP family 3-phenylpropionic acid transporter
MKGHDPRPALAGYYFLLFAGFGIFWPNYGPFLESFGLLPSETAAVIAIGPAVSLVVPPLAGILADALHARSSILRLLTAGAAVSFALWIFAVSKASAFAIATLYAIFRAPLTSIADAAAFDAVRSHGGSYGRLRLTGSLGFLICAPIGGLLLDGADRSVMVAVAAILIGAAAFAARSGPTEVRSGTRGVFRACGHFVRQPDLVVYLVATTAGWVAGSCLDACFSLHLKHLGHGATFVGTAWAVGVVSETVLIALSGRIIERIGTNLLLLACLATATARWLLLAHVTTPAAILALQPLHGVTFGLYYVAAVTIIRDRAPVEAPTAAQGIFAMTTAGGIVVGIVLAGQIFEKHGATTLFHTSAAVAALGTVAAVLYCRISRRMRSPATAPATD